MRTVAIASPSRLQAEESALRVAVVAALSATMMLFASLASALLVRRSFEDWRPAAAAWPWILLVFGLAASAGMEMAARAHGRRQIAGFAILGLSSSLYLAGALFVLGSLVSGEHGLSRPHDAFVALLLGVHVLHAILGTAFAARVLRAASGGSSETSLALARLVTHFLTALLVFILALLFIPR
jgi:heme/copper-type cytochrome/quinol oxidase subunit 3